MDVRQMRYLLAVAEELSFTKAAQRCNVSQPPLSRAIRDLEEEVGARLFERDTHSVSLTQAGKTLAASARDALLVIDGGIDRARQTAAGLMGTLRVGFGGSTVYSLMPTLVRQFRAEAHDVRLEFCAMPVLAQIEALRSGAIDLGLLRLPIFDELLEARYVYSEPLVLALPDGHSLTRQTGPVSLDRVDSERFVTYEPTRGFNFHADLLALCRIAGFAPTIVHMAQTTEAVIGIVACGEGIALVPASAQRLRMKGVVFRDLASQGAPASLSEVRFGLAWRKDRYPATVAKFVDLSSRLSLSVET